MNRKRAKRPYTKSGFYAATAVLKPHGLAGLDQRSAAVRVANGFIGELEASLGGDLSPQQRMLVELAAVELLIVRHSDTFLLEQETLLLGHGRQKRLLPLLRDRERHARFLAELMAKLGLERRERDVLDAIEIAAGNGEP